MRFKLALPARRLLPEADGFTLIEVVIALMLTVVVMTGTAAFFIESLSATRLMQQRQAASVLAERAMDSVRAMPANRLATAGDSTVRGGDTLTTSTNPAYRVHNVDYEVRTRVTPCWLPPNSTVCAGDATAPNLLMYRIRVDVRWRAGAAKSCGGPGGVCEVSVSTLRDPDGSKAQRINEVPSS